MGTLSAPPLRFSVVDSSGIMTPAWSYWAQSLYQRVGGTVAASNPSSPVEIPPDDIGQSPVNAMPMLPGFDPDTENRIAAMSAEIDLLRTQINDLKQGLSL